MQESNISGIDGHAQELELEKLSGTGRTKDS